MSILFLLPILTLLFVLPQIASAHIKWFVDSEAIVSGAHNTIPFYNATSHEVIIWSILVGVVVLVFSILDSYIPVSKKFLLYGHNHEKSIVRIAQTVLGLFLVSVSFLWKIVLVPDLYPVGMIGSVSMILQVLIGLMLIFNVLPRIASFSLGLMTLTLTYTSGYVTFIENALLLSLAIYFFIKNSPSDSWFSRKLDKHSVEIVRIGTGISLIVLAFTEKLMYPELSIAFLDVHHWNFMQPFFPWFTNELFVLSTGFAEIAFGVIFILGYLTRINTALIACFFAGSVVTMALQFQAWEVEDLVVYAAAILLIFYGHGKTKFFHHVWPNSWLHKKLF